MSAKNKKRVKHDAPSARKPIKKRSKLWTWAGFLTAPEKEKVPSKLIQIRKRGMTKRTIGKRGHRKVDITIIGLVALIGVLMSFSSVQDFFKASILSVNQKNTIVTSAHNRLGVGYQLGGTGPDGYDCSGLTSAVVKEALGISLPRTSRDQYSVGREITFENLGIGDLVFFKTYGDGISHVGIITSISSKEIKMTHANSYSGKVQEEDIKNMAYWQKTYVGAREITTATKDFVASDKPDTSYKAPKQATPDDEYNNYFPPSERNDPRLKVGAATIESNSNNTKVISDTSIQASPTPTPTTSSSTTATPSPSIQNSALSAQNSSRPSWLPADTQSSPLALATPAPTATTTPSPSVTSRTTPTPSAIATPTPSPSQLSALSSQLSFTDLSTKHYAYSAIKQLSDLKVINGYEDGTFRPDDPVTRAELTKMVYKALNKDAKGSSTTPFNDIDNNHPLGKFVLSAYRDGVIKGYSDYTFRPQNSVTKAEGSKIILKAFKVPGEKAKTLVEDIDHLAELEDYIGYMINHNLLPIIDGLIRPDSALTRAQTSYILASLL
ncbi:MAG: S-layer homology domain-containing protein [Candidatus Abawacabacteria bacterium]|nr:S-layer homology domain-containing protein [Candidatus Abawacabacteria bacterium]